MSNSVSDLGRELEAFRNLKQQLEEEIKIKFPFLKEEPPDVNKVAEFMKLVSQWLLFSKKEREIVHEITGEKAEIENDFWKAIENILKFNKSIWEFKTAQAST